MGADARDGDQARTSPGKAKLALLSLGLFGGLVVVGGAFGLLVGPNETGQRIATAPVEQLIAPSSTAAELVKGLDTNASLAEVVQAPTTTLAGEGQPASAPVEVLGVTELGLSLGPSTSISPTATISPTTTSLPALAPADVEFLELPKAVYDRFTLEQSEVLAINVAANDKIGGRLDSVETTGLGELPPGFTLESNGVLSGSTDQCGNWKLQYVLNSSNPAIGTSWIDITVGGCTQSE